MRKPDRTDLVFLLLVASAWFSVIVILMGHDKTIAELDKKMTTHEEMDWEQVFELTTEKIIQECQERTP